MPWRACAPYLRRSASAMRYLSPYLKARPGSAHGYDIVDHGQLNPELGDEVAFRRMCEALKIARARTDPRFRAQSHGCRRRRQSAVARRARMGRGCGARRLVRHRVGSRAPLPAQQDPGAAARRSVRHRARARHARAASSTPTEGSFAVWAYGTHKLPISPPHYARILGDEHAELERLADAFAWLPNWRLQMPQRAAEFKSQLAALVRAARGCARGADSARSRAFRGAPGEGASWRELDALIQRQHWRVAHFRVAADDINYRRFFNINDLAGLRIELPEVFDHVHQRVLRLVKDGMHRRAAHRSHRRPARSQGVPAAAAAAARPRAARVGTSTWWSRRSWRAHETLREDWPVDGTTGYDFLNQVLALLIDPSAESAFTDCYAQFTGEQRAFARDRAAVQAAHHGQRDGERTQRAGARHGAAGAPEPAHRRLHPDSAAPGDQGADRLLSGVPHLYRQQRRAGRRRPARPELGAGAGAAQRDRDRSERFQFSRAGADGAAWCSAPRSGFSRQSLLRCAMRLQQYSGPVVAKGVEDTAFYRYNRFIALNEVGRRSRALRRHASRPFTRPISSARSTGRTRCSPPRRTTPSAARTRARGSRRCRSSPRNGRASCRSGRASCAVRRARRRRCGLRPDRNDEYLLYQLLLGSWPCELLRLSSAGRARRCAPMPSACARRCSSRCAKRGCTPAGHFPTPSTKRR